MSINGIVLINKERGVSSNKVVNKVKYILKAEKAGHLGTLDVLGEGLLPVTLGKGTKLFDYYLSKDKVYKTVFKFGETTATLDLEGEIINQKDVKVSLQDVERVLPKFIGKQLQVPPIYSAKKIGGQKAYDLARRGEEVILKPKEIEIYSIKVLKQIERNVFQFEIHCSSGTYIRSVCRDIATSLSTYGVMLSIQRTKCGDFEISESFSIQDIEKGKYKIISLDCLFQNSVLNLSDIQTEQILNGMFIKTDCSNGKYRVYGKGNFLGLGDIENNLLKLTLRLI